MGLLGAAFFFFELLVILRSEQSTTFTTRRELLLSDEGLRWSISFPGWGFFFLKGVGDVGLGCRFRTHLIHWPRNGKMRARSRWRGSKMRDFVPVVCGPVGATLVYFRIG